MSNYLNYLESISSDKISRNRMNYFKYNFSKFIRRNMRILEIGPGLGEFITFATPYNPKLIDILDYDRATVEFLLDKFQINQSWVSGVEDIPSIESSLGTYDLIFMNQILEHAETGSVKAVLSSLYSRLAPAGTIIITVPNGNNPLGSVERYSDITHKNLFSTNSFKQLCRMSGIDDSEVLIQGYKIPPYSFRNVLGICLQKFTHLFLKLLLICNGGVHFSPLHPNISLIITKKSSAHIN